MPLCSTGVWELSTNGDNLKCRALNTKLSLDPRKRALFPREVQINAPVGAPGVAIKLVLPCFRSSCWREKENRRKVHFLLSKTCVKQRDGQHMNGGGGRKRSVIWSQSGFMWMRLAQHRMRSARSSERKWRRHNLSIPIWCCDVGSDGREEGSGGEGGMNGLMDVRNPNPTHPTHTSWSPTAVTSESQECAI